MIHYELNYNINTDKSTHCSRIKNGSSSKSWEKKKWEKQDGYERLVLLETADYQFVRCHAAVKQILTNTLCLRGSETATVCSVICSAASDNSKLIICHYLRGRPEIKAPHIEEAPRLLFNDLISQRCGDGWMGRERGHQDTWPINKESFNLPAEEDETG